MLKSYGGFGRPRGTLAAQRKFTTRLWTSFPQAAARGDLVVGPALFRLGGPESKAGRPCCCISLGDTDYLTKKYPFRFSSCLSSTDYLTLENA